VNVGMQSRGISAWSVRAALAPALTTVILAACAGPPSPSQATRVAVASSLRSAGPEVGSVCSRSTVAGCGGRALVATVR
jgi:hypothetical protein